MKQHLDGHNGPAVLGALIDWRRLCDGAQPGKGRASDAESGRGVGRSDVRPLKRQTSERRSSWAEAAVLGAGPSTAVLWTQALASTLVERRAARVVHGGHWHRLACCEGVAQSLQITHSRSAKMSPADSKVRSKHGAVVSCFLFYGGWDEGEERRRTGVSGVHLVSHSSSWLAFLEGYPSIAPRTTGTCHLALCSAMDGLMLWDSDQDRSTVEEL